MKEFIDDNNHIKMMGLVICGIRYLECEYLVYSIKRDNIDANIFVSKLVHISSGYAIDSNFSNGEKEVLSKVVQRLISKENINAINNDGFQILSNIEIEDSNSYDIDKCYVASVPVALVKDCIKYYNLVNESLLSSPEVKVRDDTQKFNEGFVGNVFLILFGVFVLVLSVCVIISMIFK